MRHCIRIPRLFIPRGDFSLWAVPDRGQRSGEDWERVANQVGGAPSALFLTLPRGAEEGAGAVLRDKMYEALESQHIEKLNRGAVLVERQTESGTRMGLVVSVDLEQVALDPSEKAPICFPCEYDRQRAEELAAARKNIPLEFPATVLLYRDKKDKAMRFFAGTDPEQLYDFSLLADGGHIRGSFIPEVDFEDAASALYGKGEPSFLAASGVEELAAAKLHWERLKEGLKPSELRRHPARFAIAELVNVYGADLRPVHRCLEDVDAETFCDFFRRKVKCKQQGSSLFPAADALSCAQRVEETVREYLHVNGGSVRCSRTAEGGDARIVMAPFDGEELFDYAKEGRLPADTFTLGGERDGRYHLEGKEIGYD